MPNPWIELHMQGEMDYTGGGYTRKMARARVLAEFEGGPSPRPCHELDCDGTMWYRATVGALMCPSCRALAHCNGDPIRPRTHD